MFWKVCAWVVVVVFNWMPLLEREDLLDQLEGLHLVKQAEDSLGPRKY